MTKLTRRAILAGAAATSVLPHLSFAQAAAKPFLIACNIQPDTTDPAMTRNTPNVRATLANIVESVVGTGHDGAQTPQLATWSVQNEGHLIEFKIKPGIKFHSGDKLTATDLEWTHQRLGQKTPFYAKYLLPIDHTEVVDELTFRIYYKTPDASFLPARSLLALSKAYHDRVGEEEFVKHPVGTGPYKFVSYKPGESLDLEAFDEYWGEKPQIKTARFLFVTDDSTRVAKLKAGEVDMIMNTPFTAVHTLESAGYSTVGVPVTPTVSIYFDRVNTKTPWTDIRVRQAMAHAIDADSIIKGLLQGIPKHYARLAPGELGYDADLKNWNFDVPAAKKLMADAGFAAGFNMPLYYQSNNYYGVRETAEAVTLYLSQIGIKCDVKPIDGPQLGEFARKLRTDPDGQFVCIWPLVVANFNDPLNGMGLSFYSKGVTGLYPNPEFDKVYEAALAEVDDAKRGELIKKAERMAFDDLASISLWNNVSTYAMRKGVSFTPTNRSFVLMQIADVKLA